MSWEGVRVVIYNSSVALHGVVVAEVQPAGGVEHVGGVEPAGGVEHTGRMVGVGIGGGGKNLVALGEQVDVEQCTEAWSLGYVECAFLEGCRHEECTEMLEAWSAESVDECAFLEGCRHEHVVGSQGKHVEGCRAERCWHGHMERHRFVEKHRRGYVEEYRVECLDGVHVLVYQREQQGEEGRMVGWG